MACKYGRTKAGTCRKRRKSRKKGGRQCKMVTIKGARRRQRMCKKGKYWRFAKAA